jgi:hypothetical protein
MHVWPIACQGPCRARATNHDVPVTVHQDGDQSATQQNMLWGMVGRLCLWVRIPHLALATPCCGNAQAGMECSNFCSDWDGSVVWMALKVCVISP